MVEYLKSYEVMRLPIAMQDVLEAKYHVVLEHVHKSFTETREKYEWNILREIKEDTDEDMIIEFINATLQQAFDSVGWDEPDIGASYEDGLEIFNSVLTETQAYINTTEFINVGKMGNKIYLVQQWDGFDFTKTIGAFATHDLAMRVAKAYQDSEAGDNYSHFVKDVEVFDTLPPGLPKKYLDSPEG